MYRHDGFRIGDAWYFVEDDEVHMRPCMSPSPSPPSKRPVSDYCLVGESPAGPFRLHGTGVIAGAAGRGLCASQLVQYRGEWYLLGALDSSISDPYRVRAGATGLSVDSV